MKTIKVSEATDTQLDGLVAKLWGLELDENNAPIWFGDEDIFSPRIEWRPTTDWSQMGPIIEREEIAVIPTGDAAHWEARVWQEEKLNFLIVYGPTPLIAAARCYVASKLGGTVEVPEELT